MILQVKDMVPQVRAAMDMNRRDDPLILGGDPETLELDSLIRSLIPDAVRAVELEAPPHLLEGGKALGDDIFFDADGGGFLILPDDFLRLIAFRMSDWAVTVTHVIDPDSPQYPLLGSKWKALRGTWQKPVCALARRQEGLVLELRSCRSTSAHITQGLYLPTPQIDTHGGIPVSRGCTRAAVYRCAAMAAALLGEPTADKLMELSKMELR